MKASIFGVLLSVLVSTIALASGGHFHPQKVVTCPNKACTSAQIEAAVPKAIEELAKWEKIDKSWAKAKVESVAQKTFKKGPEWVVTLNDAGKKRYIFITLEGYVNGSNDTGN